MVRRASSAIAMSVVWGSLTMRVTSPSSDIGASIRALSTQPQREPFGLNQGARRPPPFC
jgi:hypothetical protein